MDVADWYQNLYAYGLMFKILLTAMINHIDTGISSLNLIGESHPL